MCIYIYTSTYCGKPIPVHHDSESFYISSGESKKFPMDSDGTFCSSNPILLPSGKRLQFANLKTAI